MNTQTGSCPKCGAPIYSPSVWHGIVPPPPQYTCGCSQDLTAPATDFVQPIDLELGGGTTSASSDGYGYPYIIDTIVTNKSIEIVYRRDANFTYSIGGPTSMPYPQIYKIIYSVKKGKWHVSDKIPGLFVPASGEGYSF